MEIAAGLNCLTTTTHNPNVNLPSSGQQYNARLSARKVSVVGGNSAEDPLVRDTTTAVITSVFASINNGFIASFLANENNVNGCKKQTLGTA